MIWLALGALTMWTLALTAATFRMRRAINTRVDILSNRLNADDGRLDGQQRAMRDLSATIGEVEDRVRALEPNRRQNYDPLAVSHMP